MTECERILNKGFFDESFLLEETRCGFTVTTNRKVLWMILLDILLEFDKICQDNNLKYVLDSGSLLGAVRHNGIIPWDDDIDVAMPRSDYEKLLCLSDKFTKPYLLQYPNVGSDYLYSFAKIRNTETTFASKAFVYNDYNQGCFIDIFPYDEFSIDSCEELFDTISPLVRALSVAMKLSNPNYKCDDIKSLELLKTYEPLEIFHMIENIAKNAKIDGGAYMTSLVCTMENFRTKAFKTEWIYDTISTAFEGLEVPISKHYHNMLSLQYGDYMQFPPTHERGMQHFGAYCYPDIDYQSFKKSIATYELMDNSLLNL